MSPMQTNSLVGITDYDEGTNLSRYLIAHGWNADHALSLEEVLAELKNGTYGLVVLDEEMLSNSQWSLDEYLDAIGPETAVLVLTEPGSLLATEIPSEACSVLQHPYTNENLRLAIERTVAGYMEDENDSSIEEREVCDGSANDFSNEYDFEGFAQ